MYKEQNVFNVILLCTIFEGTTVCSIENESKLEILSLQAEYGETRKILYSTGKIVTEI